MKEPLLQGNWEIEIQEFQIRQNIFFSVFSGIKMCKNMLAYKNLLTAQ